MTNHMNDLEQSADTALLSPTQLAVLGSATVVLPPPEITNVLWALHALGWEAEAVPARTCSATAGVSTGATPSMAVRRGVARSVASLALRSKEIAHPVCGCASSLSHWWIAARPRQEASPVAASGAVSVTPPVNPPWAGDAETWEVCPASEWDQRLRACELRQVS